MITTPQHSDKSARYLDYGDLLRVLSIVAVVALHASAVRVVGLERIESVSWWTAHIIDSSCRWAVPIFVMLSGALMLDPGRQDRPTDFYRKRMKRIVVPLVFWAIVYISWRRFYHGEQMTWQDVRRSLWDGLTDYHLYYLFIIAGLYVVTPLARRLVKGTPPWMCWAVVTVMLWLSIDGWVATYLPVNATTRFVPYVSFFLMGYLLRSIPLPSLARLLLVVGFLAATLFIVTKTHDLVATLGRGDYRAFTYYDHFSIPVVVQAVCVFVGIQQVPPVRSPTMQRTIAVLSSAAFGIYLVHYLFLDVIRWQTAAAEERFLLPVILIEVAGALSMSTLVTRLLQRAPLARSIVGG